jgi:uncharacterized protein YheU (UPF0270 family)
VNNDFEREYPTRSQDASNDEAAAPVEVPMSALSPEAFANLLESFVLREGTDYGSSEVSLETKTRQVMAQVKNGKVKIVFDPALESVTLMTANDWRKLQASRGGA